MTFSLNNLVRETSATVGTGNLDLNGAPSGYRSFVSGIGDGNSTYYVITDGVDFEIGIGTVTAGAVDALARETVIDSSNAGAKVSFAEGNKTVYCALPAQKSASFDDVETLTVGNGQTLDISGGTLALADNQIDGAKIASLPVEKLVGSIDPDTLSLADGTEAAPSVSFANDADTGLYRSGEDALATAIGGTQEAITGSGQSKLHGTQSMYDWLTSTYCVLEIGDCVALSANVNNGGGLWSHNAHRDSGATWRAKVTNTVGQLGWSAGNGGYFYMDFADTTTAGDVPSFFRGVQFRRNAYSGVSANIGETNTPSDGNILYVKSTDGAQSNIIKAVNYGNVTVASVRNVATSGGTSGSDACMNVSKATSNNRSINTAGTINANGADYAEYIRKAPSCGMIEKGDICGLNTDGDLTRTYGDALSFRIKSTAPCMVGGDDWFTEELIEKDDYDGEDYAAYKADFETRLEAARQQVDRIAYAGRVPLNNPQEKTFNVGDYIVPVAAGAGIDWEAVSKTNATFEQYKSAIGVVEKICDDGRPFVSVKIG